ncbi:hypothetical protein D3C71_2194490 [compost metagenome]
MEAINLSLMEEDTNESVLGFGILNVNKRLQLNYGTPYGLIYENKLHGGIIVTVKIPFYG